MENNYRFVLESLKFKLHVEGVTSICRDEGVGTVWKSYKS